MASLDPLTRSETVLALRVLDALDRSEEPLHWHCRPRREEDRQPLRRLIALFIPTEGAVDGMDALILSAWSRNVSSTGLSFIYRGDIPHTEAVIELDGDLMQSDIIWSRPVQDGYREYGVVFRHRLADCEEPRPENP